MIDFIFGGFGALIRWVFIYRCNSKKMGEAYNANPAIEGGKNSMAGFFIVPIAIIIGLLIRYLDSK
ncbi:hypothetical protein ODZ84_09865 [Chryseobacterium fluminis]|uniref:hypothetical protein n=1 Tax=Chryseobacterium fluminis TaxID=2983606 RepID=UPI00224C934B|nr:hypothetical protein [Chryseobacterium sp. MMS21-Ot14]UZT99839.1 hypothetical protein ODZ84_09865 [Chryseobacterium sp. MMS21-Ot14]